MEGKWGGGGAQIYIWALPLLTEIVFYQAILFLFEFPFQYALLESFWKRCKSSNVFAFILFEPYPVVRLLAPVHF